MREELALVEVDKRGRVQIPLPMRKALSIEPGDIIRIKVSLAKDIRVGPRAAQESRQIRSAS